MPSYTARRNVRSLTQTSRLSIDYQKRLPVLLVLHGPSPPVGFWAGAWVPPPLCGLFGVCCGAGTALAFLARCALVGSCLVLLPPPALLRVWLAWLCCRRVGLSLAPHPFSRLWTTLGSPHVGLLPPGRSSLTHGPLAAAYVRALRALPSRRYRLIVGLAGSTLRVPSARYRAF